MVPARVFQFNWEGIELGGVRSAFLYLPEKSDYGHSGAHSGAHIVPVGPMSASECRQSYLLGTQEVFDKRPPTSRTVTFPYAQCDRRPIVPECDPSRIPEQSANESANEWR